MFDSEEKLSNSFYIALRGQLSPFSSQLAAKEFDYREGRTDIVVIDNKKNLLAFELKLCKWKQALHQAYRNSSFAHYSYVVVPEKTASIAARQEQEFLRRGVGLCALIGTKIQIKIQAKRIIPLRPWLTESALDYISGENSATNKTTI